MSGNMSESKQAHEEGAVLPITSHVIRGLRRPTVAAPATHDDDAAQGDQDHATLNQWAADKADNPVSLFEQFIDAKQTGGSDVLMQPPPPADAMPATKRRAAARKPAAKRTSAPPSGPAPTASSGTLAAFLQSKAT